MLLRDKNVGSIMCPISEYAAVSERCTLADALVALDKAQLGLARGRQHHRAVLVLNEAEEVLGKLSHWSVLRRLEAKIFTARDVSTLFVAGFSPDYIDQLEAGLAAYCENLETLCRTAAKLNVKEAMIPAGESIDEAASLMEAIHELVAAHAQSLPVKRGKKTVGILRLSDVFDLVAGMIRGCDK